METKIPSDWQVVPLGTLVKADRPISYGVVQTGEAVEAGIPCVRVVDLTSGNLSPENMITTSQEISQSYRRTILQQDDLMIALRGEIGFVAKVPPALVGANLTRGVALIAPDRSKALPDFLVQAIRSDLVRDEILNQVNGSALKEIPISGLRKVLVPIPPLPEQRAIAAILSTWDEAITLTAKLIDVLKRRKAALMQLLIRGDSDLPEGWQLGQLSDFLKQNKEYITELEDKPYPRISVKWWAKGAVVAGYDNGLNVKMERHQLAKPGQIIVSEIWAKHGSIGIIPPDGEDALITSHFFLFDFLSNAEAYRRYICALVDANYFMRQADRASKGTTGYASVRASDFLKFNVPVPPLATQKAIADVLETSDELTELYESYLERLQTQKRGLMQQLLTGAVRVEVDDSEG